jgi:hypothetical protein
MSADREKEVKKKQTDGKTEPAKIRNTKQKEKRTKTRRSARNQQPELKIEQENDAKKTR